MGRSLLLSLLLGVALTAAPALACEAHGGAEKAPSPEAKPTKKKGAKVNAQKAPGPTPSATPAAPATHTVPVKESSLLQDIDVLLSAKCTCSSAADCTCKKGQCKCSKCSGRHPTRVFEALKGETDPLKAPQNARLDATAGVFI